MDLLVAYADDPAGYNMARAISSDMEKQGDLYLGDCFDLLIIQTPAISADWLEERYSYDGFVFLSKHAAESKVLALTAHSTGNFDVAKFGGNPRQMAVPYPNLQKAYLENLYNNRDEFADFEITIEATHHGPTALSRPTLFIEIGTTSKQWNDVNLCNKIASIVSRTVKGTIPQYPTAICFGGGHYSEKFTKQVILGKYALGSVIPKHALEYIDKELFHEIMQKNKQSSVALLDWNGLGTYKQKILDLLSTTNLEVIRL